MSDPYSPSPEPAIDRAAGEARSTANRANAQHSTGPRSPEGKAKSRGNAVKHGLYVKHVELAANLLDDEPEQLDALKADLLARWRPRGAEEEWIVDRMAATWWELARFHLHNHRVVAEDLQDGTEGLFAPVQRAANRGAVEARFERALTRLRKDLAFLQRYRPHEESRRGGEAPESRIGRVISHFVRNRGNEANST